MKAAIQIRFAGLVPRLQSSPYFLRESDVRSALIAILLVVTPGLAEGQTDAPAGWFADVSTGCKAWDASPAAGETMTWSGRCEKGLATGNGTLQWLVQNKPTARYVGMYEGGRMNGHGILSMTSGDQYDGEFRDDEFSGRGVYTWMSGDRYDGLWEDGKPNGQGRKTDRGGAVFSGIWIHGCFKEGRRWATADATAKECGFD